MIKSKSTHDSFNTLMDAFTNNSRVAYLRFGDGDVLVMNNEPDSLHHPSEALSTELKKAFLFSDKNYLKALAVNYPYEPNMKHGFAPHGSNNELITRLQTIGHESVEYENAVLFPYFAIHHPKKFNHFFNCHVRCKKKLFIGSVDPSLMETLIGNISEFVELPEKNSFYTLDQWWPDVENKVQKVDFVFFSAGMASRVLIHKIWQMNLNIQLFDGGGLANAVLFYFGKKAPFTHTWIRKNWRKLSNVVYSNGYRRRLF
jgi:hypothetical protein